MGVEALPHHHGRRPPLPVTHAHVVDDDKAGHHLEASVGGDVPASRADDHPQLTLVVDLVGHARYLDGRTGPDDLKPLLDHEWSKDFVAGIIDVKSTITETADEVADRIRQVLEFVPAERVGLSTDCGLINLPRMVAAAKLRALADGAAIVRAELTKNG